MEQARDFLIDRLGECTYPSPMQGTGFIDDRAHIRLAKAQTPAELMLRRGYNYDEGPSADGGANAGLIFAAYINGVARQPEASNMLRPIAILGFALAEALAIFALVLFFIRL